MRLLVIADSLFASHERALLARMELGLADEGVEVFQAIPDGLADSLGPEVYARGVSYPPRVFPMFKNLRVQKLIQEIAKLDRLDEPEDIDIVHVFGGSIWQLGRDIARELDAGLVLEAWRSGMVNTVDDLSLDDRDRYIVLAPDTTIQQQLWKRVAKERVWLAPWGVLAGDPRPVLPDGKPPSFMLVGSGRDARAISAALQGLAPVLRENPDALVFCDALAARKAELWTIARSVGILGQLSLIEDLEGRRDLLLQGDFLLQPEANGEQRSVLLEAMASSVVVVATRDANVTLLQDGVTARVVESSSAKEWERVFRDLLADREATRLLARCAFEHIARERKASTHIRSIFQAYGSLMTQQHTTPGA